MPPSLHRLLCVLTLAISAIALSPISAAIYVKIPNIPGDVVINGYDDGNWFEAKSGSYGADRDLPTSAKGGTQDINVGVGTLKPIGLMAFLGIPTAPLLQASINGRSIGDVEIHLVDRVSGPEGEPRAVPFSIIKLKRAFVGSFEISGGADDRPWYQVHLVYNSIEMTNRHADPSGEFGEKQFTLSWNLVTDIGKLSIVALTKFTDTDKDGLSDEFEQTHFGSATAGTPSKDSDGDGESDLAEFLALTNPKDRTSVFNAKLLLNDAGDGMMVQMKTEPGRIYQLRASDDLGVFFLLGDVAGDGGMVEFVDPNPGTRRFYEVTIIPGN